MTPTILRWRASRRGRETLNVARNVMPSSRLRRVSAASSGSGCSTALHNRCAASREKNAFRRSCRLFLGHFRHQRQTRFHLVSARGTEVFDVLGNELRGWLRKKHIEKISGQRPEPKPGTVNQLNCRGSN